MSYPATRVKDFYAVDKSIICYFYIDGDGWYIYFPDAGLGSIRNHSVTEHEDGTISAIPSVLLTGHDEQGNQVQKHGYLTRGIWNEC